MSPSIPRNRSDLTPQWLSEALGQPVVEAKATIIAEGAGFMGRLARVELTYAEPGAGPPTLVAKMPTDEPGSVALGQLLRVWEREAKFYLDLAPRLSVRTPRCYYADGDADSGIYTLLMEDVGELTAGEQIAGATPDQAEAAIDWLGQFHGALSGGGAASAYDWLPSTALEAEDPMYQGLQPMLEGVWPTFLDEFGDSVPADVRTAVEQLIPRFTGALGERLLPPTVTHSDFRIDNLFFAPLGRADAQDGSKEPMEVIVIDWGSAALGQGLYDLAYFIAGSLPVEQRRVTERALVERYRRGLDANGVDVPDAEGLFTLYRKTMLYTVGVGALLIGQIDFTINQRAVDLAQTLTDRFCAAGSDLHIGEFVDG